MNIVTRTEPWEYSFLTLEPTYSVKDWVAAEKIMARFLDKTRRERGAMYSGWTVCGDKLFCREAFPDGNSLGDHLANVQPTIDQLLADAATLDQMQLHGPAEEMGKCEAALARYGTTYYEIVDGFTRLVRPYAGMPRGQSFVSLQPSFTVTDWAAAEPLLARCIELVQAAEKGCVFFGWTRSGDQLVCRQAHVCGCGTADDIVKHLANTFEAIDALVDGPAVLDAVQLHAPASRVDACKRAMPGGFHGVPVQYFTLRTGFQKYELTGYNLGMLDYSKFD